MEEKEYNQIFDLFAKSWGLVTAGTIDKYNTCTVSWGSIGKLWTRPSNKEGKVMTVYLHPARYTCEVLKESDTFTVSFFPPQYHDALAYLGSHSGKNENKIAASGLTPVELNGSVTFKEANLTFVCKKIYQHQFAKEDIDSDVQEYYKNNVRSFPVNEQGEWEPHYVFVGDILFIEDKR